MNIADMQKKNSQTTIPSDYVEEGEKNAFEGRENIAALAQITGSATFSSVIPSLTAAFEHMAQPGSNVVEILTDNIQRLQDGFVEALYGVLHTYDIDVTQKLTLRLHSDMRLVVAEERDDRKHIEDALARHAEIADAFAELASQSAALRDLHSLQKMVMFGASEDAPMQLRPTDKEIAYQISIKGDMNHFYFSKPVKKVPFIHST